MQVLSDFAFHVLRLFTSFEGIGISRSLYAFGVQPLSGLCVTLPDGPIEHLTVDSRPATIGIIVEPKADGTLRVVVQGFMNARHVPLVKHVALDGFYKHSERQLLRCPPSSSMSSTRRSVCPVPLVSFVNCCEQALALKTPVGGR